VLPHSNPTSGSCKQAKHPDADEYNEDRVPYRHPPNFFTLHDVRPDREHQATEASARVDWRCFLGRTFDTTTTTPGDERNRDNKQVALFVWRAKGAVHRQVLGQSIKQLLAVHDQSSFFQRSMKARQDLRLGAKHGARG
jgi:hypothetical protein